ncbi:MAG: UrcA family protein [Phenylobacterium sp.]|nr:UrcA family protein [Phenylobacterium sp.]
MRNRIFASLAVAAFAAAGAAPAFAQTVEQLTVTGQWNGRGEPPASLSRVVAYDDLDLRLANDQRALRQRVQTAARDICDQLGEPRPGPANLGHSCEDVAVAGAMDQVRLAVADAMTRTGPAYAVVAPPPPPAAYVAPAATSYGQAASYTTETITNGPVPDTPANRARFGGPMSHAGKHTAAAGN